MMLDMLRGLDVRGFIFHQKPWHQMTDDEKLVAVLLFMVLFAAQLIFLVTLTLILGLLWAEGPMDVVVRGPQLLLEFAPASAGVMVALLCFAWEPLRRSGQWMWLPAALLETREILLGGIHDVPHRFYQRLSAESSFEIVVNTPVVACILYSLTMFVLSRKIKGMREPVR